MTLSRDEVLRLAALARIELNEAEAADALAHLNGILGMVEQLQSVATAGIEPMSHPGGGGLRLRDDRVTETDRRSLYQSVAPQVEQGLYLVPQVIE